MDRDTLVTKAVKYLNDKFTDENQCCEEYVVAWVDAVLLFHKHAKANTCCSDALVSVQHFILAESSDEAYKVRKNAMFGNLNEVRNKGFESRFSHNVKICETYKDAYERTESEYEFNFKTRRYASYDSFRQVRTRRLKKKKE